MNKASDDKQRSHLVERTLPLFLVIITAIVVVFQAQILLDVKHELADLKEHIAIQTDVVTAGEAIEPFAALEENCTRCHSERRFMGFHGDDDDISSMISHMEMNADFELSQDEVDRIHNSIVFLKCVQCHDEEPLKMMSGMSESKKLEVIERMRSKSGSNISDQDVESIRRAMQNIQGF